MFCTRCGSQVNAGDPFCTHCGQALNPQGAPPPPPAASWNPPAVIHVTGARWLGMGWDLVKADMGGYIVISLIFFLLSSVPLIGGALIAGFHIHTIKKLSGRPAEFADLFKGFNFFIPTLVAYLLIGLFTFVGTLACIIPGLVVAAALKFTYLFIVDKKMDFWPAMQASHAIVKTNYLGFTLFLILAFLVNVLGFLCLIVGLLVTVPVTFAAITIAYKEIVGFDPRTADL
jgi:uncharacterized membrane protein